jgi:MraZ protein
MEYSFHGEYECKIDAKQRIILPALLKKQLPAKTIDLVISYGLDMCLNLHTKTDWEIRKQILTHDLDEFDEEERRLKRKLETTNLIIIDSAERILIPKKMMDEVEIKPSGDIVLRANGKVIELWSEANYKKICNLSQKDISALAMKIKKSKTK